eukprot:TRINITY_DN58205_c0_g1_i1.p1 TRINITY_DN58205_c0_g1~~TRINITY_DN58205_c0_g1_i1.p1  ORF type:complete len:179 (+),score=48.04 TRINITY_DN58205_c0_g1_i1:43-537(+)
MARVRFAWLLPLLSLLSRAACDAPAPAPSPLQIAAGEGDLAEVRKLLDARADVNFRSEYGETPLHVSGIRCEKPVIRALLAAGAHVNAQTEPGQAISMTPLHWFVNMNECDTEAVGMLLDARADMSIKNQRGQTPLDMVSLIENRAHIAELLRKRSGAEGASEL